MITKLGSVFNKSNVSIGRRKESTARVFLKIGNGQLIINNTDGSKYLQNNIMYLNLIWEPLKSLNLETKYDIIALTKGGGLTGQASSIKLGVARSLITVDSKNRSVLKINGFLKRDARIKERKKYGLKKARKASQYSKR
jgi:small subunit ribosomal protein S9